MTSTAASDSPLAAESGHTKGIGIAIAIAVLVAVVVAALIVGVFFIARRRKTRQARTSIFARNIMEPID